MSQFLFHGIMGLCSTTPRSLCDLQCAQSSIELYYKSNKKDRYNTGMNTST